MHGNCGSVSDEQFKAGHGIEFSGRGRLYSPPPRLFPVFHDCHFYHVMDLPDFGTTDGHWDLRGRAGEYLGGVDFAGKSVLEIGPASGFLTAEMEARGADVVAVEVPDKPGWDFVFYPENMLAPLRAERAKAMRRLKDSFWFTHKVLGLSARMHYGDVYNLPAELGQFDIALLASVLLHTKAPHLIIAECAKRADTIIITEMLYRDMEHCGPMMRFVPTVENKLWDTWWHFTSDFFVKTLGVMGFTNQTITTHVQMMTSQNRTAEHYTIVASR